MRLASILLAISFLAASPAYASDGWLQGHTLRLFAVEKQEPNWIVQDDVASAERTVDGTGQAVLRIHLKSEAAQRMKSLTAANVGRKVRFVWDGKTVSEMVVQGSFGEQFDLPVPPS
jgi:preprotein translocase subunit SecD